MRDHIEGDLMELHRERDHKSGKRIADLLLGIDVLLLCRPGIVKLKEQRTQNLNQSAMLQNYFKVGFRNIVKYKTFSFINIFGLSVAMSLCLLIILMLADQHRFDRFHEHGDRVYRILSSAEGARQPYATSPDPLAAALKAEYPIIEQTTSLIPAVGGDVMFDNRTAEMRGYFANPSFFDVFGFQLEMGDPKTALTSPNTIVISKKLSITMFGNDSPLGKAVSFADRQLPFPVGGTGAGKTVVDWGSFTITGVIDESKYLSHLRFDVLMSGSTRPQLLASKKIGDDLDNKWDWYFRTYTFARVRDGVNEAQLKSALTDLVDRKYAGMTAEQVKGMQFTPQPLHKIQLGLYANDTDNRMPSIGYYILIVLASVIMITACLNYTNVSIARALTRAKEIGVRKVTGAARGSLITQFISESVLTTILSLVMAIGMLLLLRPAVKDLWVNQYLNFDLPTSPGVYLIFFAFSVVIGVIAGWYPALHLSKHQPVRTLRNLDVGRRGKLGMRKVLSATQFVISMLFITTSILIYSQFRHYTKFEYEFATRNIINIELQGMDYGKLENEIRSLKEVESISATDIIAAGSTNNGLDIRRPGTNGESLMMGIMKVDENFIGNLELKLIAGSNLPASGPVSDKSIVINETASKQLGYESPAQAIGQVIETNWASPASFHIAGVVRDFRFNNVMNAHEIRPLVLQNDPTAFQYLQVKVASDDLVATVAAIESEWNALDNAHPMKYEFYDKQLADMHRGVLDLVAVIGTIAILAIIIACLGLLGMTIYTAERKSREVGIRKVLGADEMSIAMLLSSEFVKVLGFSILIGAPLSYFANNFWLQLLPNRVEFGPMIMIIAITTLLALGMLTIVSQTWRAAKANPVRALRSE